MTKKIKYYSPLHQVKLEDLSESDKLYMSHRLNLSLDRLSEAYEEDYIIDYTTLAKINEDVVELKRQKKDIRHLLSLPSYAANVLLESERFLELLTKKHSDFIFFNNQECRFILDNFFYLHEKNRVYHIEDKIGTVLLLCRSLVRSYFDSYDMTGTNWNRNTNSVKSSKAKNKTLQEEEARQRELLEILTSTFDKIGRIAKYEEYIHSFSILLSDCMTHKTLQMENILLPALIDCIQKLFPNNLDVTEQVAKNYFDIPGLTIKLGSEEHKALRKNITENYARLLRHYPRAFLEHNSNIIHSERVMHEPFLQKNEEMLECLFLAHLQEIELFTSNDAQKIFMGVFSRLDSEYKKIIAEVWPRPHTLLDMIKLEAISLVPATLEEANKGEDIEGMLLDILNIRIQKEALGSAIPLSQGNYHTPSNNEGSGNTAPSNGALSSHTSVSKI